VTAKHGLHSVRKLGTEARKRVHICQHLVTMARIKVREGHFSEIFSKEKERVGDFFDISKLFCYDAVNFGLPLKTLSLDSGIRVVCSKKRGIRMWGDQLALQGRVLLAMAASSKGATVAEIARPEEAKGSGHSRNPSIACSKKMG